MTEVVLKSLIKSPDNTKKILITFTFFYLTEAQYNENEEDEDYGELICNFQNVTLSGKVYNATCCFIYSCTIALRYDILRNMIVRNNNG